MESKEYLMKKSESYSFLLHCILDKLLDLDNKLLDVKELIKSHNLKEREIWKELPIKSMTEELKEMRMKQMIGEDITKLAEKYGTKEKI